MPDFCYYGGTITFNPNFRLDYKNTLIEKFPYMLSQHLNYKADREYYLYVSKEYHKVDGEDDPEAPHLHFILYASKWLALYRVRAISEMLKSVYGRSQFYSMTTMKTESYKKYIQKDSERLREKYGEYHYYEMNLEQPEDEFDYDDIVNDFDMD